MLNLIIKGIRKPRHIFIGLSRRCLLNWMPDKLYLKIVYYLTFHRKLDLQNPKTFNEKIQWLKLYNRKPEYTTMVDKYAAKDYVESLIGKEHIIPTLGVWERAEDIDFDALPDRFVLKCNHDSGGLVICKDKKTLDRQKAVSKLSSCLKHNGYWYGREYPYKNIKPLIIAEQYMEDSAGHGELTDYKLHFFGGECKAVMIAKNRYSAGGLDNDFYTPDWDHFDFTRGTSHNAPTPSPRPEKLDEMLALGKILAKDYPLVRIDFYVINNQIYFGEITFFPASGWNPFHPNIWDEKFGEWIKLPIES